MVRKRSKDLTLMHRHASHSDKGGSSTVLISSKEGILTIQTVEPGISRIRAELLVPVIDPEAVATASLA
ncbi:MAG TPA: hypothetical protein VIB07_03490 [Nitrososphaera sp.]|jgi:hypothetical protein